MLYLVLTSEQLMIPSYSFNEAWKTYNRLKDRNSGGKEFIAATECRVINYPDGSWVKLTVINLDAEYLGKAD